MPKIEGITGSGYIILPRSSYEGEQESQRQHYGRDVQLRRRGKEGVQKATGGTTTRYAYDGLKVAIEQVDSDDPILYMNDSSPVGGMLASYSLTYDARIHAYAYDVIGNVVGYLDDVNRTTGYGDGTSFVQEAFGNVLSGSQAGYHLTTKEYDDASGLYYFNARWYDPEIGRFICKDPPHKALGTFLYSMNMPYRYVDPSGMFVCEGGAWDVDSKGISGGVGALVGVFQSRLDFQCSSNGKWVRDCIYIAIPTGIILSASIDISGSGTVMNVCDSEDLKGQWYGDFYGGGLWINWLSQKLYKTVWNNGKPTEATLMLTGWSLGIGIPITFGGLSAEIY